MMGRGETRTEQLIERNEASMAARPWMQPAYRFRPMSSHDPAGHAFKASHPYYGWVHVQVDDVDVTMYSNDDDGVAMVYHAFGPDSYEAVSVAAWTDIAKISSSVADIGSFTGLFAMLARRACPSASIIAVEPNAAVRARLSMNLVANGFYPAIVVAPFAVSSAVGTLPLHVAWGLEVLDTGSSLNVPNAPAWLPVRAEIVTAAPIDVLLQQHGFDHVDLIKIDVEGLEVMALTGARRTLGGRPTVLIEIQGQENFVKCHSILAEQGYKVFAIDDEAVSLIPYEGDAAAWFQQNTGGRVMNFLAIARGEHISLVEKAVARIKAKVGLQPRV